MSDRSQVLVSSRANVDAVRSLLSARNVGSQTRDDVAVDFVIFLSHARATIGGAMTINPLGGFYDFVNVGTI